MNSLKSLSNKKTEGFVDFNSLNFNEYLEFEYYRLVEPFDKEVYSIEDGKIIKIKNYLCHEVWNRNEPCTNCVSQHSYKTQMQKVKLEPLGDKLFYVLSIPVVCFGKKLVLELVNDVSDSFLRENKSFGYLRNLVSDLNSFASTDNFTGLLSHRYILDQLDFMLQDNQDRVLSLVCFDIDNMKGINDNFGHIAGDNTIMEIARTLIELASEDKNIYCGRVGGDEFMMILDGYNYDQAKEKITPALEKLQHIKFSDETEYEATVSWGLKERKVGQNALKLRFLTDAEMYRFKKIQKQKSKDVLKEK